MKINRLLIYAALIILSFSCRQYPYQKQHVASMYVLDTLLAERPIITVIDSVFYLIPQGDSLDILSFTPNKDNSFEMIENSIILNDLLYDCASHLNNGFEEKLLSWLKISDQVMGYIPSQYDPVQCERQIINFPYPPCTILIASVEGGKQVQCTAMLENGESIQYIAVVHGKGHHIVAIPLYSFDVANQCRKDEGLPPLPRKVRHLFGR